MLSSLEARGCPLEEMLTEEMKLRKSNKHMGFKRVEIIRACQK